MNKLCSKCESIFRGHWVRRLGGDVASNSSQHELVAFYGQDERACPEEVLTQDYAPQNEEDLEEDFDERLKWVQLLKQESSKGPQPGKYESPLHHSIPALEISASQGCQLCNMIQDRIPRSYSGHETFDQEIWQMFADKSPRLIGV